MEAVPESSIYSGIQSKFNIFRIDIVRYRYCFHLQSCHNNTLSTPLVFFFSVSIFILLEADTEIIIVEHFTGQVIAFVYAAYLGWCAKLCDGAT